MEAAVIVDHAGLLQNQGDGLFRRHRHVPVAISRRRGMSDNILVDPFDGVTAFRRSLRWRDHEILHRDLNGRLCVPKTSHGDFRVKGQKIISAS